MVTTLLLASLLSAQLLSTQTPAPTERPALIVAGEHGETERVSTLLRSGTDVRVRDSHGQNALTAAIAANRQATATVIITFVQDLVRDAVRREIPEIAKDSQLAVASSLAAVEVQDELLNGADENGTTALMLAARNGWRETVETLIAAAISARPVDKQGRPASAYADAAGHAELAQYLRNVEKKSGKSSAAIER